MERRRSCWIAPQPIASLMSARPLVWAVLPLTCALVTVAAGCASAGAGGRPSPFPNAGVSVTSNAEAASAGDTGLTVSDVISRALLLKGVPYRLGGESPETGFDCSGLVRYVFGQARIELPRTVAEQ